MLCKGELPVVSDTQKNREGIAEHSFSINGDVGFPGCFCTVQAASAQSRLKMAVSHLDVLRVNLVFGCVKGQSRLIRPSDHFIFL